ncbi:MAG: PD40 domain-containing protein [Myxococcales bacterium]|nr:PD40 domain-containing protein [Myxococcales bacterium]
MTTGRDDAQRIAVIPAAGGAPRAFLPALEDSSISEYPAALAPDGETLLGLESRARGDGRTVDRFFLVTLAGAPSRAPIGPDGGLLRNPAWAPDGRFVVFESDADGFRDLYRMELPSGQALKLTGDREGSFEPAIAPDGQSIAYASSRDGNAEIYVMTADGGAPRRLTDSPGDDTSPRFSPDGQAIVFLSARERERGVAVHRMGRAGEAPRLVTPAPPPAAPALARDLSFSTDGSRLAYTELVPNRGRAAVVVVAFATGEVTARSDGEGIDEQPVFSPDGRHVAFTRARGRRSDIARMPVDGGEVVVLTSGDESHWLPRWISDPGCPRSEAPRVDLPSRQG